MHDAEAPTSCNFNNRISCFTLSKALLMSKRVTAVNFCLSIALRISSVVYNKDVSVECSSLLPL